MTNHPPTTDQLIADLRAADIAPGDTLIIHSSLKSISSPPPAPQTVIDALLQAVSETGTLLFPSLPFAGSMTRYLELNPHTDLRSAPITMGAIPNAAALHPDAIRSNHPTHCVIAIGPKAAELTCGNQSNQGPLGDQSPFYLATQQNAKILLIGVTNESNTTIHCAEEIAAPYIHYKTIEATSTATDGQLHHFNIHSYPVDVPRDFNTIEPRLLKDNIMQIKTLANAELRILDSKKLIDSLTQWLKEDPYLLTKNL